MRIHVKLPVGRTTTVDVPEDGRITIAQLKEKILRKDTDRGVDGECRLLFAGKELEDDLYLSDYSTNIMNESELHLLLRVRDVVDVERLPFRGMDRLTDYVIESKIGGKDLSAPMAGGYTQSGVCSYVYRARLRGRSRALALKVMINATSANETLAIGDEFHAEYFLLSNAARLPGHPNIMAVLHTFVDSVAGSLPGWEFDPDVVSRRTMVLVMRFYPRDLKVALKSAHRAGQRTMPGR